MDYMKLTRKELYELVWSAPIARLAPQYGFSDVWLARICKRNRVPRPPRGYWARLQSGQKVSRTPLPKGDNGKIITITVHDPIHKKEKTISRKTYFPKELLKPAALSGNMLDLHPLMVQSARILDEVKEDDNTGIVTPQEDCIDMCVSRDSLSRAFGFMNSLIQLLSAMGLQVFLSEGLTVVDIHGVLLGVTLVEELDRKRKLKAIDHDLEGRYEFGYRLFDKKAYPTGILCFSIDGLGFDCQIRKTWRDTDSLRLEDYLKSIVLGLIRLADKKKASIFRDEAKENE